MPNPNLGVITHDPTEITVNALAYKNGIRPPRSLNERPDVLKKFFPDSHIVCMTKIYISNFAVEYVFVFLIFIGFKERKGKRLLRELLPADDDTNVGIGKCQPNFTQPVPIRDTVWICEGDDISFCFSHPVIARCIRPLPCFGKQANAGTSPDDFGRIIR